MSLVSDFFGGTPEIFSILWQIFIFMHKIVSENWFSSKSATMLVISH